MRTLHTDKIIEAVKEMCISANLYLADWCLIFSGNLHILDQLIQDLLAERAVFLFCRLTYLSIHIICQIQEWQCSS